MPFDDGAPWTLLASAVARSGKSIQMPKTLVAGSTPRGVDRRRRAAALARRLRSANRRVTPTRKTGIVSATVRIAFLC